MSPAFITYFLLLQMQDVIQINWSTILAQLGISSVVLVIWWITFTKFFNRQENYQKDLLKILQQDNEYKQLLAGILARIESKIDIHVQHHLRRSPNEQ